MSIDPGTMRVVKLGGSLYGGPQLGRWLDACASAGAGRGLVVVPGGGRFADTVRDEQRRCGFDDVAAHRMALLAMDQAGEMLCAMDRRLYPARDRDQLLAISRGGRCAVWLPSSMLRDDAGIEASWSVTSDSLAAWVARAIDAQELWLVKAGQPPVGADWRQPRVRSRDVLEAISAQALVDRSFAIHASGIALAIRHQHDLADW